MKKTIIISLCIALLLALCCAVFVGCDFANNTNSSSQGGNNQGGNQGSTTVDDEAKVTGITGGNVDGLILSLEVSPQTNNVDLSGMISVSKNSSWQLYADISGQMLIPTKFATDLDDGNNTYYIVVNSSDGKTNRTYTLNIWKNFYATVYYYINNDLVDTQRNVLTHTYLSEKIPQKRGYSLVEGWNCDGYYVESEVVSFNAVMKPNEYVITLDLDGGECRILSQGILFDNSYKLPVPTKEGYSFNGWIYKGELVTDSNGQSINPWKNDYDAKMTASWTINRYTIEFLTNNSDAGKLSNQGTNRPEFNSKISSTATTYLGYNFLGWFKDDTLISAEPTLTITVTAQNETYIAKWEEKEELSIFDFSSSETTCKINGVKDKAITSVNIPDYVTTIGSYAFDDCKSLTSIIIPNSVTSIGSYAFLNCYKLVEVCNKSSLNITKGSTDYGYVAYHAKEVYEDDYSSKINTTDDGYVIYSDDNSILLLGYIGSETDLILPSYITEIYQYAFYYCSSLTSITIPNGVTSIGARAFYECTSLKSIIIPNSVTSIGNSAFSGCQIENATMPILALPYIKKDNLLSLVINGGSTIKDSFFQKCSSLTSVVIGDSVTSIGTNAFSSCSSLTSVVIGDSMTTIGGYAFDGCSSLTSVTIGKSVTTIGDYAFRNCSSLTSVVIGDSVTSIGTNAFSSCSSLTSVTIGNSVKSIGNYAFNGCSGLNEVHISDIAKWCEISFDNIYANPLVYAKNLYLYDARITAWIIPDNVTAIGDYAFYNWSSLTSITIPDSVTSIGKEAFRLCKSLTSIIIPENVTSIGNYAFADCNRIKTVQWNATNASVSYNPIFYNCSAITTVILGNNVQVIPAYTFYECTSLTSITIPENVTSIGGSAFSSCSSLTSITIPDSVTTIGDYAFSGCSSLTSITIPDSVTTIGDYAFMDCNLLTLYCEAKSQPSGWRSKWNYSNCFTVWSCIFENDYAFSITDDNAIFKGLLNRNISHFEVPSTVNYNEKVYEIILICDYAFRGCTSLTSIVIPDSVTTIDSYAFWDCKNLTSVTIGNSVTSIGARAFYFCSSLTSVTIGNSVTTIGTNAFYYCSSLTSVTIGNSVTTIGDYAFSYCSSLTSITIPDSVTSIGTDAFYFCYSLTSVTIGNSVTSIGNNAFYACKSLTSVTIGNSVTTIGNNAFYYCSSLTSVTIPDSLTTIGTNAFRECSSLTSVTIGNSVTSIGDYAFCGCSSLTSIIIPESVTSIGQGAFIGSSLSVIYCEAKSKPSGWEPHWNEKENNRYFTVVWGYKPE